MKVVLAAGSLAFTLIGTGAQAEIRDCTEIASVPTTITVPGIYCFKQDLATNNTTGNAITISASNVLIDMNGFKLGGLGAGPSTNANGIFASDRLNITIRNGSIRGFRKNIELDATGEATLSSGHIIEDMRIESAREKGISVRGTHSIIRNNFILNTGNHTSNISAFGVNVIQGQGHSVTGNTISGVTEQTNAFGIFVDQATGSDIRGNDIRDLTGGEQSFGIRLSGGAGVVARENVVVNVTIGTVGISGASSSDACLDNVVTGFTTKVSDCALDVGNLTY